MAATSLAGPNESTLHFTTRPPRHRKQSTPAYAPYCAGSGDFPKSLNGWTKELKQNRAVDAVEQLGDRPLLILHGINDRQVPYEEASHLASRHPNPELRLISGADHRIRHDPRAVAVLLGWLERQAAAQYA